MKVNVLTLFPEMFTPVTETSILGKANKKNLISINLVNIRDYTKDKHKKTDDTPFGGGCGMTMQCQPIFDAVKSLETDGPIIYMSPRGRILDMDYIERLSELDEFTILCGHYEGVDQRVLDYFHAEEVSIGDYILTGGELPAMVLIDSVSRFIPDVLGNEESAKDESVYCGLLEADQYSKPRNYEGMEIPEVLSHGNHKAIAIWKLKNSLKRTYESRPDLFDKWLKNSCGLNSVESYPSLASFTKKERKEIKDYIISLMTDNKSRDI